MIHVSIVPPDRVWEIWPSILPYIELAAEHTHGRFTVDDIYASVAEQQLYLLWIAFDSEGIKGIVVTGFAEYPRLRALVTHFCAGEDGHSWKEPMLSTLQSWARDNDCDVIESQGRLGWAKIFKADGYKPLWQTYELPVNAGAGDDNG